MTTLPRRCLGCARMIAAGSRCSGCDTKASTDARGYGYGWQQIRLLILDRDKRTCQWCGAPATTVDHLRPLAHGGGTTPDNLVASCLRCNSRRGATTRRKF